MTTHDEKTTALPGLLSTIAAGFDVITRHIWVVLFPICLDIIYWIGPQLRSTDLWLSIADMFRELGVMVSMADQLTDVAGHTNLFTVFSVPWLGIPALMAGMIMPEQTPIAPLAFEVDGPLMWLALFGLISFFGLLTSAVYHAIIARAVRTEAQSLTPNLARRSFVRRLPRYCLRIVGLAILLVMMVAVLYAPLMIVATVATLINAALGSLVIFMGLVMILWIIFYLIFGLHGIVLRDRPVFLSLLDSMRVVRHNWTSTLVLFFLILAVRNLFSWIWLLVDNGSWFTLVNIAGYAFVNTGLVAATFIFYRDRITLLEQGFLNEQIQEHRS